MEICGLGVLIRGPSGIGKGELALELISRGHRLIADDAPLINLLAPHSLCGECPPLLRNLLEVRSLGVLNIAALFGEQAVASSTPLQLIVTLETIAEVAPGVLPPATLVRPCTSSEITERDIAGLTHNTCRLLDVDIPEIRLALRGHSRHPASRDISTSLYVTGRPTALLVETLVKNFKLQQQGYFAHADLSNRQRRVMDSS
jgi:HPr kinase/phosphorylase